MPVFTEEQRARLQKSRAERAKPLNVVESSASYEHASVSEHTLSNIQKQKELQDLQDAEARQGRTEEGMESQEIEGGARGERQMYHQGATTKRAKEP